MAKPILNVVEPATEADVPIIVTMITQFFNRPHVYSHREKYDPRALDHLVIRVGNAFGASASWVVRGDAVRVVWVQVDERYRKTGLGMALSGALERTAVREGLRRLELSVTNDNVPALGFWQRSGYRITGVAVGEMERLLETGGHSRKGVRGLPIRDEIQMEKRIPEGRWIGLSDGRDGAAID